MNKLISVTKNEFKRYFTSPVAYVYLVAFLLLNSASAIYFGNFLERGQASLINMFAFQPWIYLIFIPGISMRLWSEEFRTKTIMQIMTIPISTSTLVWGKFFASLLFCGLALSLTFPFWITVNILGTPDNGIIAISYIGSFILAGCMLAISQTMSSLTKNQVISLVLSVIANILFFMSGLNFVLEFLKVLLPLTIIDMIASFSFLTHFQNIMFGLIEARDILFFASIILLFNFITIITISIKTSGTAKFLKSTSKSIYIISFSMLLIGFLGLNLLANTYLRNIRIDFSEEKTFTLTEATKQILKELPEPVTAKLFYSTALGESNPAYREFFNKTRLILKEYQSISDGKFNYQIYHPSLLNRAEDMAMVNNLQPIPLINNSTNAYFGLYVIDEADKKQTVPLFVLDRANFIEQDLTEALYLLNHKKKSLGVFTTLPVFDTSIDKVVTQQWEIITQIKKFFTTEYISSIKDIKNNNYDTIMLIHPQRVDKEFAQAITDYTNKGGKVIAFVDIAAEASRIFAPSENVLRPSNIKELENIWKVKFHNEYVIADLGNSISVDATTDYKTNPIITQDIIQFYIREDGFNPNAPETAMLKKILMSSASLVLPQKNSPNTFTPLLRAGKNSQLMSSEVIYRAINPAELLRHFKKDENPKIVAARLTNKSKDKPLDVIIVTDTDMLYDSFWSKSITLLENKINIPILDNANFVLNLLDSLNGETRLIGLRGKSQKDRLFKNLEKRRIEAIRDFKIQEKDIFDKIEQTKKEINEIWNKKSFEERTNFTTDELTTIANTRQKLNDLRQNLISIKNKANNELESTYNIIKFYNIYFIPLIIIIGFAFYSIFTSRNKIKYPNKIIICKEIILLSVIGIALLVFGVLASLKDNQATSLSLENTTIFSNLAENINKVSNIQIKDNKSTLHIYKDGNEWKIKDNNKVLVLQDRIKSFLSSILSAKYYEMKSNKVEHLSKFGLTPIEKKNSTTTRVELQDNNGTIIESFDLGKTNIDLGRGNKGAYIKFDNKFQVWLAELDIINISSHEEDWTYSNVWDHRLGKISKANKTTDVKILSNIMKNILNTPIVISKEDIKTQTKYFEIKISAEYAQEVTITFYKNKDKSFMRYEFNKLKDNSNLQSFANYATSSVYKISNENLEKIKHATFNTRPKQPTKKNSNNL